MPSPSIAQALILRTRQFAQDCDALRFDPPVAAVYNPLQYAAAPHEAFLAKFFDSTKQAVFLGMNPGPFGMAQTGVPFGEINAVRDFLGICAPVHKPAHEHPKRPISGFDCPRSEVSGRRLWGLFQSLFPNPHDFFQRFAVLNYCPLAFLAPSGANITPDKLPAAERAPLNALCDAFLIDALTILQPAKLVGIGAFAHKCLDRIAPALPFPTTTHALLHPSPASPIANRDWPHRPLQQLADANLLPTQQP